MQTKETQKTENKTVQNNVNKTKPTTNLKGIDGWQDIVNDFKTEGKIMLFTEKGIFRMKSMGSL